MCVSVCEHKACWASVYKLRQQIPVLRWQIHGLQTDAHRKEQFIFRERDHFFLIDTLSAQNFHSERTDLRPSAENTSEKKTFF